MIRTQYYLIGDIQYDIIQYDIMHNINLSTQIIMKIRNKYKL